MSQGVFVSVTRQNAWELGSHWVEPILWYARGVKAMKARAIDDPLIWRFWRAIHGFDQARWQALGYWNPGAPTNFAPYGDQCQHGSWYFLPGIADTCSPSTRWFAPRSSSWEATRIGHCHTGITSRPIRTACLLPSLLGQTDQATTRLYAPALRPQRRWQRLRSAESGQPERVG